MALFGDKLKRAGPDTEYPEEEEKNQELL